ncbi:MAG: COX15/CtaA family protein [Methylophaga sp.]
MTVRALIRIAFILAFIVITLGALTRLLDAGLGCPDWPGCYGKLIPPSQTALNEPTVMDTGKAWMEMIHRYTAGLLGLILLLVSLKVERSPSISSRARWLTRGLLLLVIAQAVFGMWTVTLQLLPQIVTIHLLGGMSLLVLIWVLRRQLSPPLPVEVDKRVKLAAAMVLLLLIIQITLGGWTSSQYAGLACPDFPTCQGKWLPDMDMQQAFNISDFVAANHEGGLLSLEARTAIQVVHRLFALLLTVSIIALGIAMWRHPRLKATVVTLMGLIALQLSLGIANAVLLLPLPLALAHNTGAALLLLCMTDIVFRLQSQTHSVVRQHHSPISQSTG